MSEQKIKIIPFSDINFNRLVELTMSTYAGREISDEIYLKWEYTNNPDGSAIIYTAVTENKIASQYIVIPRTYSINNKLIKGSLSVNTLTHPDYRGLNLFANLAAETFKQCGKEEIQFTIGFPNSISLPIIKKKKILNLAGYLPLLIKPLNPLLSLLKYILGKKNKTGDEIQLNIPEFINSIDTNVSLFDFNADAEHYEVFLKNFNKQNQNVAYRSISFLKWRYVDIPKRNYYILKIKSGNEIMAAIILRSRFMYGIRTMVLVDIFSIENQYTERLIKTVNIIAVENKIDLIISTVPFHSSEYKILRKGGYYSVPSALMPQKLAVIAKLHSTSCPEQISDFSKWFLTFGDYDIF